jgi:hypothetical protein
VGVTTLIADCRPCLGGGEIVVLGVCDVVVVAYLHLLIRFPLLLFVSAVLGKVPEVHIRDGTRDSVVVVALESVEVRMGWVLVGCVRAYRGG